LPKDLSELHQELNHFRKAVFYEGEDLDAEEIEIEETLVDVETAVSITEDDADLGAEEGGGAS
jgi:hypothetical protein